MSSYAWAFSWLVVGLAALAAGAGVIEPGLYRDNPLVTAAWFGNDLVTLFVAVPVLVGSMALARRGSSRARLVWMGMLLYMLYGFQFYLFGAAFNALFLAYTALVLFSALGLVFGLAGVDIDALSRSLRPGPSDRVVAAWMLLVAVFVGGFWTALSVRYWVTGAVPPMVDATSHPTNVTGDLDLAMVVGLGVLAAAWLWRHDGWGYVLAVVWNVKGAGYMLALSMASVTAWTRGPAADAVQVAIWTPIGIGCLVSTVLLLRRLGPGPVHHGPPAQAGEPGRAFADGRRSG